MSNDLINRSDLKDVDLSARIEIAQKVGRILSRDSKSADRTASLELAQILIEDASVSVRETLARELKKCSFLPEDLVQQICDDIDQVSMPFLIASDAVDDSFLEDIIRNCGSRKQEAIASREGISEALSYAICDVATKGAVEILIDNGSAEMSERACNRVVDRFPEECSLLEKLCGRGDLPLAIVERIIFKVSENFSQYLMERFSLAEDYASYLTSLAKRQVFATALEISPLSEIRNYLSGLHKAGGINSDVLLGYLQNGSPRLFISSLAVMHNIPYEAVDDRISGGNATALARLLETAGFSKSVVGVLVIAYQRLFKK